MIRETAPLRLDDLILPEVQRDLTIREPGARTWLNTLENLTATTLHQWDLNPKEILHGGRAGAVLRVEEAQVYGPPKQLVLKLPFSTQRAAQEAAALEHFANTDATVKLEKADLERGALLLEWVPTTVTMRSIRTSQGATLPNFEELNRLAQLLLKLRTAPSVQPNQHQLTAVDTLEEFHTKRLRSGSFREVAPGTRPPTPANLARALSTLEFLSSTSRGHDQHLLHGDLNSGNVLGTQTLKAVDPRPLRGDPAYDTAVLALKRSPSDPEKTAALLASLTGDDRERVLCWLFVAQASRV